MDLTKSSGRKEESLSDKTTWASPNVLKKAHHQKLGFFLKRNITMNSLIDNVQESTSKQRVIQKTC